MRLLQSETRGMDSEVAHSPSLAQVLTLTLTLAFTLALTLTLTLTRAGLARAAVRLTRR